MSDSQSSARGQWASRLGFILAAAGSAIGLGNVWKFPYITGMNGGGLFVLIYLFCIAVVALPILIAEIIVGRATQRSPVGAFQAVEGRPDTPWKLLGWMGFVAGFVILSYYSVVAGWTLHYTWLSIKGAFWGPGADEIKAIFGGVYSDPGVNIFWHTVVMAATVAIVVGGVGGGIERANKILLPLLFVMMGVLLVDAMTLDGFTRGVDFILVPHAERLKPAAVLEALGHSFFTLSLGMGAMLTYGSYLSKDSDVVSSGATIATLDTTIAMMACLVVFPVLFTAGFEPQAGPGLVFQSLPVAFSQMVGGQGLAVIFFLLLFFAAVTSTISLLEVVSSTFIDQFGWGRKKAALVMAGLIFALGIPSALSGSTELFGATWEGIFGKNFFDSFDWLASNALLPLGGFLIAVYVGWVMPDDVRRREFTSGSRFASQYGIWLFFLRFVSPVAIFLLLLFSVGIIPKDILQ